jgi:N-acetylmuramoyl-L-alanine amidase
MSYESYDDVNLLALCIWREARGEVNDAQLGVGCSIRNRVNNPSWYNHHQGSYRATILMPWQYSSFNTNDPNSTKYPDPNDAVWLQCLENASLIINGNCDDNTSGAISYYDKSLDSNPPKWATDGEMIKTVDLGRIHFFKKV